MIDPDGTLWQRHTESHFYEAAICTSLQACPHLSSAHLRLHCLPALGCCHGTMSPIHSPRGVWTWGGSACLAGSQQFRILRAATATMQVTSADLHTLSLAPGRAPARSAAGGVGERRARARGEAAPHDGVPAGGAGAHWRRPEPRGP